MAPNSLRVVHRVFVDSNVLGSKTQYDWLFMLKQECAMFAVCTSDDVLDEAHRVWRRKHPNAGGEMRAQRAALFRDNFDEVLAEWTGGAASDLRDVDDTHVHNAARSAEVDILLTNNVSDFGDPALLPYDLYTPDEFFLLIDSNKPADVLAVARRQAIYWHRRNESQSTSERVTLADALRKAGCPGFAAAVESHLQTLSGPPAPAGSGLLPEGQAEPLPEVIASEQLS